MQKKNQSPNLAISVEKPDATDVLAEGCKACRQAIYFQSHWPELLQLTMVSFG